MCRSRFRVQLLRAVIGRRLPPAKPPDSSAGLVIVVVAVVAAKGGVPPAAVALPLLLVKLPVILLMLMSLLEAPVDTGTACDGCGAGTRGEGGTNDGRMPQSAPMLTGLNRVNGRGEPGGCGAAKDDASGVLLTPALLLSDGLPNSGLPPLLLTAPATAAATGAATATVPMPSSPGDSDRERSIAPVLAAMVVEVVTVVVAAPVLLAEPVLLAMDTLCACANPRGLFPANALLPLPLLLGPCSPPAVAAEDAVDASQMTHGGTGTGLPDRPPPPAVAPVPTGGEPLKAAGLAPAHADDDDAGLGPRRAKREARGDMAALVLAAAAAAGVLVVVQAAGVPALLAGLGVIPDVTELPAMLVPLVLVPAELEDSAAAEPPAAAAGGDPPPASDDCTSDAPPDADADAASSSAALPDAEEAVGDVIGANCACDCRFCSGGGIANSRAGLRRGCFC